MFSAFVVPSIFLFCIVRMCVPIPMLSYPILRSLCVQPQTESVYAVVEGLIHGPHRASHLLIQVIDVGGVNYLGKRLFERNEGTDVGICLQRSLQSLDSDIFRRTLPTGRT